MSDSNQVEISNASTGWMKLFHPTGALVTLPVPCDVADMDCYKMAFQAVSQAVAAGFSVSAPGLEAGEERQEIGWVVRKSKENNRGGSTHVIDLYPANEAAKFSFLTVYLNNDDEIAAFEAASRLRVESLPLYIGDNKIERGKKRDTDAFVIAAPKPFTVIYGANPKYDEKEAVAAQATGKMYPVPKRKFIRWPEVQATATIDPNSREANGTVQPGKVNTTPSPDNIDKKVTANWQAFLLNDPNADLLNLRLKDYYAIGDKHTQRAVFRMIDEYAKRAGFEWDNNRKQFIPPVDVPQDDDQQPIPF